MLAMDGGSSVSEDRPSGLSRTMIAPDTGAVRGSPGGRAEAGTSTSVTAEIPSVPAGPSYGVLLPDGTIWYPGSEKRLPAPIALRVTVWALAFLVLVAAAGVFVIHSHPSWVDPLRRSVPAGATTPKVQTGGAQTGGTTPPTSPGTAAVSKTSPQPSNIPSFTTAYTLNGISNYVISVKATNLTWVQAHHLVDNLDYGSPVYSQTLSPGQTATIPASGSFDLEVAAAGATVTILSNGKVVGTLGAPPSVPWHFWLSPASS